MKDNVEREAATKIRSTQKRRYRKDAELFSNEDQRKRR
jgi:hypothetical protein